MKFPKTKGSAILTTIFLLFGILAVAVIGLEIIMSGLTARRAQGASAQAFWATETGIERAVMAFKLDKDKVQNNNYQPLFASCSGEADRFLKFCDSNAGNCDTVDATLCSDGANLQNKKIYYLNNDPTKPSYWVKVKIVGRNVTLTSQGGYQTTNRQLRVSFCMPDCNNKSGQDDGCGGKCK